MSDRRKNVLTSLPAVPVRIVAAEQNTSLITINELAEPTQWLASGSITEVLLVDLGGVAPSQDVVACLTADGHSLLEAVADVGTLGSIAGRMDGVLSDGAGVPCPGSAHRSVGASGSCSCALLATCKHIERTSDGSGSS